MSATFSCSNCGAPLDYTGTDPMIRCPYCGTSVIVPEELRSTSHAIRMVSAMVPSMNITAMAKELGQVMQLARAGKQVKAVKLFRESFGVSEEQAQMVVERIASGRSHQFSSVMVGTPAQVSETPPVKSKRSNTGCILLLAIAVVGFIAIITARLVYLARQDLDTGNRIVTTAISVQTAVHAEVAQLTPTQAAPPKPTATPTSGPVSVALTFGGKGTGVGYFDKAHGLGVDGKGNVYVGEYIGGRIQVFDAEGNFITQWFAGDKNTVLFGFAADRNGVVYVADGKNITRYEGATGKSLGKLAYADPRFGNVAVAPNGRVAAIWYERRSGIFTSTEGAREDLVLFDEQGQVTQVVQGPVSSQTEYLALGNAIAVDGRGEVYILNDDSRSIFKFGGDGKLITRFGAPGNKPGQLNSPRYIAIDQQGQVFVSDSTGLQVFDAKGGYLETIELDHLLTWFAFDDNNQLWGLGNNQVFKLIINDKK